jgi:hypothetical protein
VHHGIRLGFLGELSRISFLGVLRVFWVVDGVGFSWVLPGPNAEQPARPRLSGGGFAAVWGRYGGGFSVGFFGSRRRAASPEAVFWAAAWWAVSTGAVLGGIGVSWVARLGRDLYIGM